MKRNNQDLAYISERQYIYALKVLAIISIVSAHCFTITNMNKLNIAFSGLLALVGSIGVGVFFIISGYLFLNNKYDIKVFFLKKINTIFLPWIVTGTAVYLYIYLRKGGLGFSSWLHYLLGNGSYLYYLTLLTIFYLLFFYTSKSKKFIFSTMVLSILSIVLTSMGLLKGINHYLNPLNFIGYFSVGIMIARKNNLLDLAKKFANYKLLLMSIYILLLLLIRHFEVTAGYWGYATLIVQPVAISLVFSLATMGFIYNDRILKLGIQSFSIYLLHMPVAGVVTFIFNHFDWWTLTLVRPFIIIGITIGFIYLYKSVVERFKIGRHFYSIIGFKEDSVTVVKSAMKHRNGSRVSG